MESGQGPSPPVHLYGQGPSPVHLYVPMDLQEEQDATTQTKSQSQFQIDPKHHLQTALEKLTAVATTCDVSEKLNQLRNMDHGSKITNSSNLKHLMKTIFGLALSKLELISLKRHFDEDGGGTIDFLEFKTGLSKVIKDGRLAMEKKRKSDSERVRRRIDKHAQDHRDKHCGVMVAEVDRSYGEKSKISALRKIAKAASRYGSDRSGQNPLAVFEGNLDSYQFKEQLRKTFSIKLSPKELGSLLDRFDGDGDGTINGTEFLLEFVKIRDATKKALRQTRISEAQAAKAYYDKKGEECLQRFAKNPETKMDANYTDNDYQKAMRKLEKVALFFDAARSTSLVGFQGLLDPNDFASQLFRCFGIKVTEKELGSMVNHFDRDSSGTVDGTEFLLGFNGMAHRAKQLEKQRIKEDSVFRRSVLDKTHKKNKNKFKKKLEALKLPSLMDSSIALHENSNTNNNNNNNNNTNNHKKRNHQPTPFDSSSFLNPNPFQRSTSTYMHMRIEGGSPISPLNGRVSTAVAREICADDISLGKLLKASTLDIYSQKANFREKRAKKELKSKETRRSVEEEAQFRVNLEIALEEEEEYKRLFACEVTNGRESVGVGVKIMH